MLYDNYATRFGLHKTAAAVEVGLTLGVSDKTIRVWHRGFISNGGQFSEYQRGKYERYIVIDDEEYKEMALTWIRLNSSVKGRPNMTAADFRTWVGACTEIVGPFQEPLLCNWSPSIFDAWAASAHGCLVTWDTTEAKVQSWKKSYHKTTLRPINLAIVSDPTVRLTRQRGSYPALYPVLSSIVWLKKRCKKLLHSKFVLTIHSQILSFVQRLSQKECISYKKITSLLYTPSKK